MTDLTNWENDISSEDETDDGIIELTDIVDEGPEDANKESIIELTDIVKEENTSLPMDSEKEEETDFNLEIEEIEIAGLDMDSEEDNVDFDLKSEDEENIDFDIDIEEEESASLSMDSEEETIDFDLDIVTEESYEVEEDLPSDGVEFVSKGLELEADDLEDSGVEKNETKTSIQDLNVSREQVEAALERVIENKFADKIDTILFDVMETVIEKEISKIKESLLKDFDINGNV